MPLTLAPKTLHRDTHPSGRPLTTPERETLIQRYLPTTTDPSTAASRTRSSCLPYYPRAFLALILHQLLYCTIQTLFSLYIRLRQVYNALHDRTFAVLYYHHRTPGLIKRDVKHLSRVPKHLSVIVDLDNDDGRKEAGAEGLAKLIRDVAEISAWCACAGIPKLSVYERSGALKSHVPCLHNAIFSTFRVYYPPIDLPTLHIRAPHYTAYSPPPSRTTSPSPSNPHNPTNPLLSPPRPSLNLLLLSSSDGRPTLVDLTKTLAEMSQRGKLHPLDISAHLIDAELSEASCGEPDLLVLMAPSAYRLAGKSRGRGRSGGKGEDDETVGAGGDVCLRGYPPWQVRLTEIFHVQDNAGVEYQVFLRALHRYAKAELKFGR